MALQGYKIVKIFPKDEQFGLISQMRRAAVSVASNIAEGFSRQSSKEKIQFYFIALGSVTELQNQFLLARGLSYVNKQDFKEAAELTVIVAKLLNALIIKDKNFVALTTIYQLLATCDEPLSIH